MLRSSRSVIPFVLLGLTTAVVVACSSSSHTATSSSLSASSRSTSASSSAAPTSSSATTSTIDDSVQHFASPEAAMTYLAAAWNAQDEVALKHVTDPGARDQLDAMHTEAVNLRFDHCVAREGFGDYVCYFDHAYPAGYVSHTSDGLPVQAEVLVGPADTPGWYMTYFRGCG